VNQHLIGDMARSLGLPVLKNAAGVVTRRLPIPQPLLMVGSGSAARLAQAVGDFGHRKVLVVTDAQLVGLGLLETVFEALKAAGSAFVVFDEITPDAPIPLVERGIACFEREQCDAVLAVGGGSVLDAAKVIALATANDRAPRELAGYFRARHRPAPIYAVPTTAGTGSEVTAAAVIDDPESGRKLVVADTRIVPKLAALDPMLMAGLPPAITAATGMDALTHAVEAFIGTWSTTETDRLALAAVGMIFQTLPRACTAGDDLAARERMALASTYAGMAFTRANVGNVHALAHQLGARYHTPHGLANAILLPPVLRFSAQAAAGRMAVLAGRAGVAEGPGGEAGKAQRFIDAVQSVNDRVGIPRTLEALREADIAELAEAACREADLNYPVPRIMGQADAQALLREVLPAAAAAKAVRKRAAPRRTTTP
jgi:alcohol dehydrogenase class IV